MLRDYVVTDLSAQQLGDLLTMTGFELEEITEVEGEEVLDVNIMANRGDGASVLGLAREVLAKDASAQPTELYLRAAARFPAADAEAVEVKAKTSVEIHNSDCTRYACRVFEGLTNGPAPDWVQERLRKVGQRPISLLVDLTNYVMLETGQPLHAFDLDKLAGQKIVVRAPQAGETLRTLDGTEHELRPDQMMICDGERPVAAAGIMGGEETEVSASTTRCLLESAHFINTSVRRTRKQLGLQTEASYRFERHVDPEGVVAALNRFAELLEEATGIKPVPGIIDVWPSQLPVFTATVRMSKVHEWANMPVTQSEARGYLERLGFTILSEAEGSLTVQSPSWRIDVTREHDLVEEIARVHGYEKIGELDPIGSTPRGGLLGFEGTVETLRSAALMCGFDEVCSHSLRDAHALDAETERTLVRNPHAPEMAHLRNSLLPGLAEAAGRNGSRDLHLFEVGRVHAGFTPGEDHPSRETQSLAFLSTGQFEGPHWGPKDASKADFFSLKASLDVLADALRLPLQLQPLATDARFHPTRCATVSFGPTVLGVMGQIHPNVADACDLPAETFLAELNLDALRGAPTGQTHFHPISRNPAMRRDIAVVAPTELSYAELSAQVATAAGELLERHWLFDIYTGPGIPEGHRSLALGLQLRKMGANLNDEEANAVRDRVVQALESVGARLR